MTDDDDSFRQNLRQYVKKPPIKSNFAEKPNNQLVVNPSRRGNWENGRDAGGSRITVAPILMYCGPDPELQTNADEVAELFATLRDLNVVPRIFFFDARQNMKDAVQGFISKVYEKIAPGPTTDLKLQTNLLPGFGTNRYTSDFEELEEIGVGGFGVVYKVKCRLDNAYYAVKKIKLKKNDSALPGKIKEEIQLLASLNHPNVIRYHCGWVGEEAPPSPQQFPAKRFRSPFSPLRIQEITDEEEIRRLKSHGDEQEHIVDMPATPVTRKSSSDSDAGSFASLTSDEGDAQVAGKFWNGGDSSDPSDFESSGVEEVRRLASSVESSTLSSGESSEMQIQRKLSPPPRPSSPSPSMTLFIQMELCGMTLEDHLRKRNGMAKFKNFPIIDGEFNRELCLQLLSALQYIHSNHIIHRDIKPANIFLKPDGRHCRVLLGDFGLACVEAGDGHSESEDEEEEVFVRPIQPKSRARLPSMHSIGVGTTTYAAPEQLQSADYCSAVDIYSAGIVFYELYNIFSTSMERLRHIEKLRAGRTVTGYLEQKWPSVAPTIISMTEISPSDRPTAGQLLQKFKGDESFSNKALLEIIQQQKDTIAALQNQIVAMKTSRKKKQCPGI